MAQLLYLHLPKKINHMQYTIHGPYGSECLSLTISEFYSPASIGDLRTRSNDMARNFSRNSWRESVPLRMRPQNIRNKLTLMGLNEDMLLQLLALKMSSQKQRRNLLGDFVELKIMLSQWFYCLLPFVALTSAYIFEVLEMSMQSSLKLTLLNNFGTKNTGRQLNVALLCGSIMASIRGQMIHAFFPGMLI